MNGQVQYNERSAICFSVNNIMSIYICDVNCDYLLCLSVCSRVFGQKSPQGARAPYMDWDWTTADWQRGFCVVHLYYSEYCDMVYFVRGSIYDFDLLKY